MKDWQAYIRMHFIHAGIESGLLDALSTPSSRDELLEQLRVKRPEILDAVLDVGLSVKELTYKDGKYIIVGKRSKAITGSQGDMLAAMIQANITYYSSSYRNAADRMHGAPLGDDLHEIGCLVARFSKIGEPFIREFMTPIVKGKKPTRVLDVGCGSGVFLQTIYNANQNATGLGIDIDEEVVEQANQNMEAWGLSDRFRILAGDILSPPDGLEGPFDFISIFNIIYYFPSDKRSKLIDKLGSMLSPDGTLAVAMHFQSRGKDLGAANLNMVNSSLKGLTPLPDLDDLMTQLRQRGFNRITTQRLMPGSTFWGVSASIA
jgi:2-polyprenyl-3-methyl-5-hydroxy-6-metoxy-1,4-benzoquinol methylase